MFGARKKEIQRLQEENKALREAVYPLTKLGIPINMISGLLKPYADSISPVLDKMREEASHRSYGTSASSPIRTR
jgi:hypothetical protein